MKQKSENEVTSYLYNEEIRSEEVQEIITSVPSWIMRWGISIVFSVLGGIILLSSLIEYPDVINVNLKVNSVNAPKTVISYQNGKLISILVNDGEVVKQNQILAYLESSANPEDVLNLSSVLKRMQSDIFSNVSSSQKLPLDLDLGELQGAYQTFYRDFLEYQATQTNGYYLSRRVFLHKELSDITVLRKQILAQKKIQEQEFKNQETEYQSYRTLFQKKVISRSEFAQQENKYLSAKYPLQQTESSLLNNSSSYSSKEKELLDLEHIIAEQQSKFIQSLNQCLTEIDKWVLIHLLRAPLDGKVSFAGIIQPNQNVTANQEIFVVDPGEANFFGEVQIPQYNMGKIRIGEKALIKLHSYPFEQYGVVKGTLTYVSEVAYRDSVFVGKISLDHFENKDKFKKIILKNGMRADAEIITEENSLLQRFFRNMKKMLSTGK
jgi:multidrug efflux pump subunit AcrA (membrane-fusion protein)